MSFSAVLTDCIPKICKRALVGNASALVKMAERATGSDKKNEENQGTRFCLG